MNKVKMPKSKRDRKIALSKTTKKVGLETKQVSVGLPAVQFQFHDFFTFLLIELGGQNQVLRR